MVPTAPAVRHRRGGEGRRRRLAVARDKRDKREILKTICVHNLPLFSSSYINLTPPQFSASAGRRLSNHKRKVNSAS